MEPTDVQDPVESVDTAGTETADAPTLLEDELLVEEISIDGMCGVY